MSDLFSLLAAQPGTTLHQGADDEALAMAEKALGFAFPSDLKSILLRTNGAEVFNGYFRLFGVGCSDCINSLQWNREDHWKFAWKGRASGYWCFGESAWGDQYAYLISDLRESKPSPIYQLSVWTMMPPDSTWKTLSEFISAQALHQNPSNLDWWDKQQREVYPEVAWAKHLVYCPPLEFLPPGGNFDMQYVMSIEARPAMISVADVTLQFQEAGESVAIPACFPEPNMDAEIARLKAEGIRIAEAFEIYEDDKGRTRIRVVWR